MKKALLSAAITSLFAIGASATVHNITVQNFNFTPTTMTVPMGDTIVFTWINGSHTTTSLAIPAGATPWDHPMNSNSQIFTYVPTVSGTYNYQCTPHAPDMAGSFIVSAPAGISTVAIAGLTVYPNPAKGILHISLPDATATTIQLVSTNGSIVHQATITKSADINTGNLANGTYFLSVQQGNTATVRTITVAH